MKFLDDVDRYAGFEGLSKLLVDPYDVDKLVCQVIL